MPNFQILEALNRPSFLDLVPTRLYKDEATLFSYRDSLCQTGNILAYAPEKGHTHTIVQPDTSDADLALFQLRLLSGHPPTTQQHRYKLDSFRCHA